MKKRIVSLLLTLLLCFSLVGTALAASDGFDASVTVNRETAGQISVTVNADTAILSSKKPTLSVPCSYTYAQVTGPNGNVAANLADGMVSFKVEVGGTYTVYQLFAVTFDANGGSVEPASAVTGTDGKLAELPTPTRRGYWEFVGWYTAASGGIEITEDTVYTADTTIYAQWDYYAPYIPSTPSIPAVSTQTTENADGSVTTTVTNNVTGTVTATTVNLDGSSIEVETRADGTVTVTTKTALGVTSTVELDADGDMTSISAEVSAQAAAGGAVVTLPIEILAGDDRVVEIGVPADGAMVEIPVAGVTAGTVAVIVHEDGTEEIVQNCKMTEAGIALELVEDVRLKVVDNSKDFEDVKAGDWFKDAVDFVSARGIVNGISSEANIYNPDGACTRAMIVTILWRLEGCPVVDYLMKFEDVATDTWYTEAVRWAASEGIVNGYSDIAFGPTDSVTREQMITILYRYAQFRGVDVSVDEDTNILNYGDASDISVWAIPAMQWGCGTGLVRGDGANLFPKADTNRGQLAQFTMNFIQII